MLWASGVGQTAVALLCQAEAGHVDLSFVRGLVFKLLSGRRIWQQDSGGFTALAVYLNKYLKWLCPWH